jgi:predicted neuraminidase
MVRRRAVLSILAMSYLGGEKILAQVVSSAADQESPIVLREFIADSSPTPQCHASTIAESRGHVVAAWFGGEYERHPGVGIWVAQRDSNGWSRPMEAANGLQDDGSRYPCWNPVLFQPVHGPLMLFYKVGPSPSTWWGVLTTSSDGGRTWAHPGRLPDGVLGPIKNKPVECPEGVIVCPSSTEDHGWQVRCETTTDQGITWRVSEALNDTSAVEAIQPSFVRNGESGVLAFGRTKQERMFVMRSSDCGATWSPMRFSSLPNPNSGLDAVGLHSGPILLVYNHAAGSHERWDAGREVLNVALSVDGEHWRKVITLEQEPGSEFSYPAAIQTADGLVHVTYTWKRSKIAHVIIDPSRFADSSVLGAP